MCEYADGPMTRLDKMKKILPVFFVFFAFIYIANLDFDLADNHCNALSSEGEQVIPCIIYL